MSCPPPTLQADRFGSGSVPLPSALRASSVRKRPRELGSRTSDAGSACDAAGVTSVAGGGAYTSKYARIESTVLHFASGIAAYVDLAAASTEPEFRALSDALEARFPLATLRESAATRGRASRRLVNLETHMPVSALGEYSHQPLPYVYALERWVQALVKSRSDMGRALLAMFLRLNSDEVVPLHPLRRSGPSRGLSVTFTGAQYLVPYVVDHRRSLRGVPAQSLHRDNDDPGCEVCIMITGDGHLLGTIFADPTSHKGDLRHAHTRAFAFDPFAYHAGPAQAELDCSGYGRGRYSFHFMAASTSVGRARDFQERNGAAARELVTFRVL